MTTDDHHEPPPLAAKPLHKVEPFDHSGTFKIKLVDLVENEASDPPLRNYRGDSAQNFIYVLFITSLLILNGLKGLLCILYFVSLI